MTRSLSLVRAVVAWAVGFLACLGCVVVLSASIAYRSASRNAGEGMIIHPLVVQTPFSEVRGISPPEFSQMTKLPICPRAAAEELGLLGYSDRRLDSRHVVDSTFLRLRTDEPLSAVDKWYQDHLGPSFIRSEGAFAAIAKDDVQIQGLARDPDVLTVSFRQKKIDASDEVLLEPGDNTGSLMITLIHRGR